MFLDFCGRRGFLIFTVFFFWLEFLFFTSSLQPVGSFFWHHLFKERIYPLIQKKIYFFERIFIVRLLILDNTF